MPYKRSCLRLAHTNGHSHCCYTESGEHVITTGSDGDIRIWNGVDDDDPNTQCVGEFILYHAYYEQRILTSTDSNTVQAYTYPDYNRDGTEFRFTAPVTCIKVNAKFMAACSEDMVIKVTPRDKSIEAFEFSEHTGPVLRIDLSVNDLLASSSGDGTIKIWNLGEKKCIKTISGFDKIKSYQVTHVFVTPSFEPKRGKFMAYNQDKSIIIVDTQSWEVKKTLTDEKNKSKYSVCSYSKCGKYLAAGGENGEFTVWDIEANKIIQEDKSGDSEAQCITAIDWNPSNSGEFVYTDNTGQFGLIENITNDDDEDILERAESNGMDEDVDFAGEDAVNENCVSLGKRADDQTLEGASIKTGPTNDVDDANSDGRSTAAGHYMKSYERPFQPSETPKSLEHRYMVWNSIGIVRAHSTNTENSTTENSIEVEFHDASIHHELQIENHLNHTMASLSSTVLALCNERPSILECIRLDGSGDNQKWSMAMPDCEEILCVAASSKLVAVATEIRWLRIFDTTGKPGKKVLLPGPVVAVAAHDDRVVVAYHSSTASEDQHISMMLIHTNGLQSDEFEVALTPNAKLAWLGFSDEGSLVTCDTMGMVRMFLDRSNDWILICDTSSQTEGASDTHFIIDISEASRIVRSILCRGTSYPLTTPKPTVLELKMQMPVCDIEAEPSQAEEMLVRVPSDPNNVFSEECVYSFDTPDTPTGLYVSLATFLGFGHEHVKGYYQKTRHSVFIHISREKLPGNRIYEYDYKRKILQFKRGLFEEIERTQAASIGLERSMDAALEWFEENAPKTTELDLTKSSSTLQPIRGKRFTGMKNLDNSCYMNSVMQLLFTIPDFIDRFVDKAPQIFARYPSDAPNNLDVQFAKLGVGLRSGKYSSISPVMFKKLIGKNHMVFSSNEPQDAHEFLIHVIEKLEKHSHNEKNPADAFRFQFEHSTKHHNGTVKYQKQNSWCLTLNIPENDVRQSIPLDSCIELFGQAESINRQTKTTRLATMPDFMMLHLNRYRLSNSECVKLDVSVEIPEILDLSTLRSPARQPNADLLSEGSSTSDGNVSPPNLIDMAEEMVNDAYFTPLGDADTQIEYRDGDSQYKLVAFISHLGASMKDGHYVCHILENDKWFKYDDSEVSISQEPPKESGYLYLWKRHVAAASPIQNQPISPVSIHPFRPEPKRLNLTQLIDLNEKGFVKNMFVACHACEGRGNIENTKYMDHIEQCDGKKKKEEKMARVKKSGTVEELRNKILPYIDLNSAGKKITTKELLMKLLEKFEKDNKKK